MAIKPYLQSSNPRYSSPDFAKWGLDIIQESIPVDGGEVTTTDQEMEETLAFYYWDRDNWVKEPSSVVDLAGRGLLQPHLITCRPGRYLVRRSVYFYHLSLSDSVSVMEEF